VNNTFEPISLDRQNQYQTFLDHCPQPTSDYSFINLWGWQEEYGLTWAFMPDCVCILQTVPEPVLWAPMGDWETIDWDRFFSTCSEYKRINRVPEQLKDIWLKTKPELHIEEARGQWDYLYSIPELVELSGRKFHKKKNLLNQFLNNYTYAYVPLNIEEIERALTLQTEWFLWKNAESDSTLGKENRAIVKVLRDWEKLDHVMGAGLIADDKMIAYTIAECVTKDQMIIHFEKGCPNYKGVYQAMNQLFLKQSCCGKQVVNREQDLDDQGLRKAKESYNPIGYMKKYLVTVTD